MIRKDTNATEPGQRHQSLVSILAKDVWNVNSSKIVDENEPLVVYHGSPEKFTEFDKRKIGSHTVIRYSENGTSENINNFWNSC